MEELNQEVDYIISNPRLRRELGIKLEPRVLLPKIGRNESCPCGSNKKFKKCCIEIYDREYLYQPNQS